MTPKPPKPKKCKVCRATFTPARPFQSWCSPECGLELARKKQAQAAAKKATAERQADRVKREKLKTRADWIKDAQYEFNRFIRLRDASKPCICCGLPLEAQQASVGGGFDAGHYRSVGASPNLRFNEDNCHGQRKQCNRWGAGRAVDYRIGLIARIGIDRVEALELDNTPRHYTVEALKQLRDEYRAKAKAIEQAKL
jgi:predicted nucleic acid-binding Zn ribbon protein